MEPSGNTETEDGTVPAAKKTARRVSFADNEITSVHLFPTDDANDSEQTPPLNAVERHNDVVSSPFLVPTVSPHSSTDDEEEAFRAPVSASFIATGRFSGSDSGFSDDLTMDSTAFSLHYRSIARSDSADLRTPSQTSIPTASGSFMTLTKAKNQLSSSSVRTADSAIGARVSNDMSVVEGDENPFRFDYNRISPSLDAILAERSKDLSSGPESANRSAYFVAKSKEALIQSPGSMINNVLERKHDESPGKGVIVVGNCVQEAPTPSLTSLQARLSELRRGDIQDSLHEGNLDGNDLSAEISSAKKRKAYETLREGNRVDEIERINTSPQLHKCRKGDKLLVLEGTSDLRSDNEKLGDQTRKTWTDIVKDFSRDTKWLLSPSVDELNLKAIGVLEDILVQLQKVSLCEGFCSEIHSQKIADTLDIPRHKRFEEARSLLFNLVYGKTKLQLMHIKLERLRKKSQLSSGLQKLQMEKLNEIPSKHEALDSQANDRRAGEVNVPVRPVLTSEKRSKRKQDDAGVSRPQKDKGAQRSKKSQKRTVVDLPARSLTSSGRGSKSNQPSDSQYTVSNPHKQTSPSRSRSHKSTGGGDPTIQHSPLQVDDQEASGSSKEVSCEKVTMMRQELETLDQKAKSLIKSFHTYCKMENHQSLADTIIHIRDYLKKNIYCKCILLNLQFWDIADFEHVEGCYRVVLNYYGYVIQRFTVNDCPTPSIIISNELNDVNIVKTFPDLDAYLAFMFVFNPHTTKKHTDTKLLAQETQVTSSLLSNLLDVIKEAQLARIENRNMIHAKFYSESVGQLDLLLSFIDFGSGRKVKVTLDMTCLRCGVYPIETLPYSIHDPDSGEHKSSSIVAEIRTALKSLRVGHSRIMRLCRCISQALQACTLSP